MLAGSPIRCWLFCWLAIALMSRSCIRGHACRGAARARGRCIGQRQPGPVRAAARRLRGGISQCRGAAGDPFDLDRLDRGGDGAVDRADAARRGGGLDADRRCGWRPSASPRRSRRAPRALFGGGTSISGAIDYAMGMLAHAPYRGQRQVVDVSGDGANNRGRPAEDARDAAVQAGVTINGLPILTLEPDLDRLLPAERDRRPRRIRDRGKELRGIRRGGAQQAGHRDCRRSLTRTGCRCRSARGRTRRAHRVVRPAYRAARPAHHTSCRTAWSRPAGGARSHGGSAGR